MEALQSITQQEKHFSLETLCTNVDPVLTCLTGYRIRLFRNTLIQRTG